LEIANPEPATKAIAQPSHSGIITHFLHWRHRDALDSLQYIESALTMSVLQLLFSTWFKIVRREIDFPTPMQYNFRDALTGT